MFKKFISMVTAVLMLTAGITFIGATAAVASSDTSLNTTTSKIKGVAIASATATSCLDGPTCATFPSNQVAVTLTSAQAADVSNSGSFMTTFVATNAGATVNKIVKPTYSFGGGYNVSTFNSASPWSPSSTIGSQDNLLVKVTAADGVTVAYYGFKFSITYPPATLASTSKIKGVTITDFGTPNTTTASVVAGSITISSAQAADTSNSGSFVTSFVNSDSAVNVPVTVRKAPSGTALGSISSAYNGSSAIVDGDIFLVFVPPQSGISSKYAFVVTVTAGGSSSSSSSAPTLTAAEIAAAAEAAAKAAAQAAAEARAAAIATAQTALATVLRGNKAGTLSEYRSANINITTTAALTRLNAEVLKLSAADRTDFAKIKAIADKIEFDESFFNATARPSIATYSTYGVTGVTERILPTINAKVLELPAALRVDVKAMQDLVKVESFVDRVANTETRSTVSSSVLVEKGLLSSASPYKYSVVRGLGVYPEGSLNTMAKIEAAIKEQIYKAEAPKRRLAEIKAQIAARKK